MKTDLKKIKAGIGLGVLKFGMDRAEVKQMLGEPDEVEHYSFSEQENDLTEAWHYDAMELSLGFDEAAEWRLTTISVTSKYYELENKQLIGLHKDEILPLLNDLNMQDYEIDDLSSDRQPGQELIVSDSMGIHLWFDHEILHEIEWGPMWQDEFTITWPQ